VEGPRRSDDLSVGAGVVAAPPSIYTRTNRTESCPQPHGAERHCSLFRPMRARRVGGYGDWYCTRLDCWSSHRLSSGFYAEQAAAGPACGQCAWITNHVHDRKPA
jgi:hypothetical protein